MGDGSVRSTTLASSARSCRSHMDSLVAGLWPVYLASQVDRAPVGWSFADHWCTTNCKNVARCRSSSLVVTGPVRNREAGEGSNAVGEYELQINGSSEVSNMRTTKSHSTTVGFDANRLATETAKAISGHAPSIQYMR